MSDTVRIRISILFCLMVATFLRALWLRDNDAAERIVFGLVILCLINEWGCSRTGASIWPIYKFVCLCVGGYGLSWLPQDAKANLFPLTCVCCAILLNIVVQMDDTIRVLRQYAEWFSRFTDIRRMQN